MNEQTEIVAVDIGGTHARFAIATVDQDRVVALGPETVLRTSDYAGLAEAWQAYAASLDRPLPRRAGIAIAAPLDGDILRMTNNRWLVRRSGIAAEIGLDRTVFVNDFEAIGYAVGQCGPGDLQHLCGSDRPLPAVGAISIVGPGTGLGVAILHRSAAGDAVIATEGGHIAFAPLDALEGHVHDLLHDRFGRVSVERVVSGPGLSAIHAALGCGSTRGDRETWAAALSGEDPSAVTALDAFCKCLGSVAGDLALAHGAGAVVIAGGLGLRLAGHLPRSGFSERFIAKGRYADRMAALPVRLLTHPQPGLLGAAAAFAAKSTG